MILSRTNKSTFDIVFLGMIYLTFVALSYVDPYAGGMVVANMIPL